ncbi:hypothetical protein PSCICF_21240 [Pseudomonas cichorii]|nr:hypothetical protein PSCICF_21240 [Pseudomonas cichorii]
MKTYFLSGEVEVELTFKPIEALLYKENSEWFFINLASSQAAWSLFHEPSVKVESSKPIKVISVEWQMAETAANEKTLLKNRISVNFFAALFFCTTSPIMRSL